MKGFLVVLAAAIVGNMIAEKFLLKSGENDTSGTILAEEGFGMDDVARAAAIAGAYFLAKKFLPS